MAVSTGGRIVELALSIFILLCIWYIALSLVGGGDES